MPEMDWAQSENRTSLSFTLMCFFESDALLGDPGLLFS